jgi:hypothetical protein
MTPQEFYDGPAAKLEALARAKRALMWDPPTPAAWFEKASAAWDAVCAFARRPNARKGRIYDDLAEVVALIVVLAEKFVGEPDIIGRAMGIMKPKMVDYANDADFSHNFQRSARRAGLRPAQVWVVFADKHWGSVASYVEAGKTESEAVEDRLADLVNYCLLLAGMVETGIAIPQVDTRDNFPS